jgi:hypothetical protein
MWKSKQLAVTDNVKLSSPLKNFTTNGIMKQVWGEGMMVS